MKDFKLIIDLEDEIIEMPFSVPESGSPTKEEYTSKSKGWTVSTDPLFDVLNNDCSDITDEEIYTFEYYLKRKGLYYFRNKIGGKFTISSETYSDEVMKGKKYGQQITINMPF